MQNITLRRIWSFIKAIFITIGACRPEIRSASAETVRTKKKITSLITKEPSVWHEGDRNRTNWLVNLGVNSWWIRARAMPLRHVCGTDSVKISLLIYIIIDLQGALLLCSQLLQQKKRRRKYWLFLVILDVFIVKTIVWNKWQWWCVCACLGGLVGAIFDVKFWLQIPLCHWKCLP